MDLLAAEMLGRTGRIRASTTRDLRRARPARAIRASTRRRRRRRRRALDEALPERRPRRHALAGEKIIAKLT